jgi:prepilin-type N-terminal cleavage/methylation domain-containing protein
MKRKRDFGFVFCGMTLVELLVVMAIMAILVAISIPSLKPMLESQRAANGARVVALKLQQTRLKAMREDRPCGVEFMRYGTNASEGNVSLQMRTVKDAHNFTQLFVGGYEIRCVVIGDSSGGNAEIQLVKKRSTDTEWTKINEENPAAADEHIVNTWKLKVFAGLRIQFNNQGKWFDLADSFHVANCHSSLPSDVDTDPSASTYPHAVNFEVTQRPRAMLNAVTVLPRGTVVDLQYSGHDTNMSGEGDMSFHRTPPPNVTRVTSSVIVMFSPAGYVDRFYIDGAEDSGVNKPFRGVFYLLVGEWDKIDRGEDNKNNLETESNFWVTIKDRDGTVRTSPNTVGDNVSDRRKHAREDLYNNIGGL